MSGNNIIQTDRDHVAQVMEYYCTRTKRDQCPVVATVTASLSNDLQGATTNRNAIHPLRVLFKTAKQLNAMYIFLQRTRSEFHDIIVHISVDGSPYFEIL